MRDGEKSSGEYGRASAILAVTLPHVCGVDVRAGKEGRRMNRTDVGTRVGARVRNGWSRGEQLGV